MDSPSRNIICSKHQRCHVNQLARQQKPTGTLANTVPGTSQIFHLYIWYLGTRCFAIQMCPGQQPHTMLMLLHKHRGGLYFRLTNKDLSGQHTSLMQTDNLTGDTAHSNLSNLIHDFLKSLSKIIHPLFCECLKLKCQPKE